MVAVEEPLVRRGAGRSSKDADTEAGPRLRSFNKSKLDYGHWPSVVAAACLLAWFAHAACSNESGWLLRREETQLTLLEEQLMGCRTKKSDPIPSVDTTASLKVLDTYTPEQRQQAEAYTAAVSACADFACLQRANELPRAPGQFHYPHFFILGFPKCATTSVYCHLITHPQIQYPLHKEPHTLMDKCARPGMECPPEVQREYVVDILNMAETAQANFTKAAFEGSTHYALEAEWLAPRLAETFPWLRVLISMREPVSQAIAMHLHNLSHNRETNCTADLSDTSIFHCVRRSLKSRSRYGDKLRKWMEFFPREKLQLIQFESMTQESTMEGVMSGLKSFLGISTDAISNVLPLTNWKHQRGDEDAVGRYWPMARIEYQYLVDMARNDTMEVMGLMQEHGYVDEKAAREWTRLWEAVWEENLASCDESNRCKIEVSG